MQLDIANVGRQEAAGEMTVEALDAKLGQNFEVVAEQWAARR